MDIITGVVNIRFKHTFNIHIFNTTIIVTGLISQNENLLNEYATTSFIQYQLVENSIS